MFHQRGERVQKEVPCPKPRKWLISDSRACSPYPCTMVPAASEQGSLCQSLYLLIIDEAQVLNLQAPASRLQFPHL